MSVALFTEAWLRTGKEEGGYVNNPLDSGGPTNWGITQQLARAHGFMGDMRDLPRERAREIAKEQFWDLMRLDEIARICQPLAFEMFDAGFLSGQATVVQWLQRCLNVGNRVQADYPDLRADGVMGKISIAALSAFLAKRGARGQLALLNAMNGLESAHFTTLAERREKDETFWLGWQSNRVRFPS